MIKRILLITLFIMFLAMLYGAIAPSFSIEDINGNMLRSATLLESGPIFLNFWNKGCRPCLTFLPHLSRFAEEFPEMTFIAISNDPPRARDGALGHVRQNRFSFTTAFDTTRDLQRLFNVSAVPHKIIINQEGQIVYNFIRFLAGDEIEIERIIKETLGIEYEE
jgi:thiol-disulfide isomerase/thioredoxin